jgi:hypothetical protein
MHLRTIAIASSSAMYAFCSSLGPTCLSCTLHANYRNAIGHRGLVIRHAKLVFPMASDFCKRVSEPYSIQHIIGTNGAFYRACYPSAG